MYQIDKNITQSTGSKLRPAAARKTRIVWASALLLAACAFGAAGVAPIAPDAADLPVRSISEELELPQLSEQIAAKTQTELHYMSEEKVRPGDTLAVLLNRLGVDDAAAASFIKSDQAARAILNLKAGMLVQARVSESGQLQWLSSTVSDSRSAPVRNIVVKRDGDSFQASDTPAALEKRVEMRSGDIRSSLFAATDAAQIPDNVAMQIVDMFSTDIDFASDLRRGDRFNVVYETYWQNGDYVRAGRVLAAEFRNAGKTYQAVWFEESNNKQGGYYTFDGKSLKKAFLKSPLEFSRISSGFSMRMHPISGKWKQHKGVDFAAVTGTPIRAAGEGVVDFAGVKGGYGNVVVLKHWGQYSTLYAHMNGFAKGIRKGTKVNQGQVIGYVGSTGWSTGPHLHYEFRVNNVPRDPMSINIPTAQTLTAGDLPRFRAVAAEMSHRFTLLNPDNNTLLASR